MIFGIGTDICDVRRIRSAYERRGDRFAVRVLGPQEMKVFSGRLTRVYARGLAYLASRFAVKEAFSKAVGLGMRLPMSWRACEVVNAPSGQPRIALHGELAAWFEARALTAHVTLTDETDYAVAFVVVEQRPSAATLATSYS